MQQLHKRLEEINKFQLEPQLTKFGQFQIIPNDERNCYCLINPNIIFNVNSFGSENGEVTVRGQKVEVTENYFVEPVESSPALGIITCNSLSSDI